MRRAEPRPLEPRPLEPHLFCMFSMHGNMHFICLLFFIIIRFSLGAPERGPCDPLVPEYCILPFPNSFYAGEWFGTGTGLKVNISDHTPPRDSLGRLLDTTSWNLFGLCVYACTHARTSFLFHYPLSLDVESTNDFSPSLSFPPLLSPSLPLSLLPSHFLYLSFLVDGYSLFPSIITYFPDLSDSSNLPPHWDISRSLSLDSPTLIYNINTGIHVILVIQVNTCAHTLIYTCYFFYCVMNHYILRCIDTSFC